MLQYRSFCNTDPPVLASIWRSRRGQPGLLQPVSSDVLEQLVLAKPYFEYEGLIVARQEGRPVGFAHAGFGPNETEDRISTGLGVTCMVIVRPDCAEAEVAAGLLARCEAYLRGRGAKVLYGGGIRPLNPFYLGLYGGSELPGVLGSDAVACALYRRQGYREIDRTCIFHRGVEGFQAPVSRQQMQLRRSTVVEVTVDPPARSWWEACTTGDFDLTQFQLVPRGGGPPLARALLRNLEPTGAGGPARAAGVIELEIDAGYRRQGLATYLLVEVFRQLARQGVGVNGAARYHLVLVGLTGVIRDVGVDHLATGPPHRRRRITHHVGVTGIETHAGIGRRHFGEDIRQLAYVPADGVVAGQILEGVGDAAAGAELAQLSDGLPQLPESLLPLLLADPAVANRGAVDHD